MSTTQFNVVHDALVRVSEKTNSGRFKCPTTRAKTTTYQSRDTTNRVQITCFNRSCDPKFILESLGLSLRDIYHENPPQRRTQFRQSGLLTPEQLSNELLEILFFKLLIDDDSIKVSEKYYPRSALAGKRLAKYFSIKWSAK
ncbi:MAG TPA: hypothetical protein EYM93_03430 [Methylococcales bacterium]|nr:hypothetical protein [Methylococcales bacterium]